MEVPPDLQPSNTVRQCKALEFDRGGSDFVTSNVFNILYRKRIRRVLLLDRCAKTHREWIDHAYRIQCRPTRELVVFDLPQLF